MMQNGKGGRRRFPAIALLVVFFLLYPCLPLIADTGEVLDLEANRWFASERFNMLVAVAVFCGAIIYCIHRASTGKVPFVRRLGGVEAVDEAVGRSTEMGRPVLFIPGIQDMDEMQTLAGLTILGRVAEKIAEYQTQLIMPTSRSLVMSAGQEVVKEAFLRAGRPDAYRSDDVFYLTDDQFGFTAGVDGIMLREKPATLFMLGAFYAESLVLAETGNRIGAIQIAGTAMPTQIPFFVAACDYTLIGEELFAASAYLSGEPKLLGSLQGQDIGKVVFIVAVIITILLEIFICFGMASEQMSILNWFAPR